MTKAFDIVAYTYRAATFCPRCTLIQSYLDVGLGLPALDVYTVETRLGILAERLDIDRMNESTFDSDKFPKVVFASQVEGREYCEKCHEEIG